MQTPNKKFKLSYNCSNIGSAIPSPGIKLDNDLPVDLPKPLLHVLNKQNQFTTKKQKYLTPHNSSSLRRPPRPMIHSSIIKSRLSSSFHSFDNDKRAHVISFRQSDSLGDDAKLNLSQLYDENNEELYFKQCFDIEDHIGSGSFADVFKVRSKDDGNYYAIKVSRKKFMGPKDREEKLREVAKHEQLPEHPHLVKFYQAWEERQRLFIQTELCIMSLSTYAELNHDIDEVIIRKFLLDLLKAVAHLHEHDLIHLDIKPANIFISQNGACKLGDYGLIFDLKNDTNEEANEGDAKYLAREVFQGTFTKSADIFSLGMTILELATDLDLPSGGSCWGDLRENRIPDEHLNRMSSELRQIIKHMLNQNHEQRPTAKELLEHPFIKSLENERQDELSNGQFKPPSPPAPLTISKNVTPPTGIAIATPIIVGSSLSYSATELDHGSPNVSPPQNYLKNNISAYLDIYTDSSDDSFNQRARDIQDWPSRHRDHSFSDSSDDGYRIADNNISRIEALKSIPTRLFFESDEENEDPPHEIKKKEDCLQSDGTDYVLEFDNDDVVELKPGCEDENMNEEFDDESKFVPPSASTCQRIRKSFSYNLRNSKTVNGRSLSKAFYDLENEI